MATTDRGTGAFPTEAKQEAKYIMDELRRCSGKDILVCTIDYSDLSIGTEKYRLDMLVDFEYIVSGDKLIPFIGDTSAIIWAGIFTNGKTNVIYRNETINRPVLDNVRTSHALFHKEVRKVLDMGKHTLRKMAFGAEAAEKLLRAERTTQ